MRILSFNRVENKYAADGVENINAKILKVLLFKLNNCSRKTKKFSIVFKSRLLAMCQNMSTSGKGLSAIKQSRGRPIKIFSLWS